MNPAAPITLADEVNAGDLLLLGSGLHDTTPQKEVRRWVDHMSGQAVPAAGNRTPGPHLRHQHSTDDLVTSFCLLFEKEINWIGFGLWLSMLLNRHGAQILRVKGILNIAQAEYPIAIHGVQHLVHPPVHLKSWPDEDRRSRIVFIVRNITREAIERSFKAFCETSM
jgi:G3E family GTPase